MVKCEYFICTFPNLEILNYPVTLENKTNKQQQKPLKVKRNILAQITENKYIFYLAYISEKQSLLNQISVPHALCLDVTKISANCLKIIIL